MAGKRRRINIIFNFLLALAREPGAAAPEKVEE